MRFGRASLRSGGKVLRLPLALALGMGLSLGLSLEGVGAALADETADLKREIAAAQRQNDALQRRIEGLERAQAQRAAAPADAGRNFSAIAAQAPGAAPADAPRAKMTDAPRANTTDWPRALASDAPLSWRGLTLFGVVDAGLAWQSHGAPFNGAYPQGLDYAISKNSNRSMFSVAPGGMGYSGIGLKGSETLAPGLAGVFAVNSQFNSASGQLANGPASLVQNNGLPLAAQSANGDSARAGQAFNDYAWFGLSSSSLGVLTFGRQRTLSTDDRAIYDPIGGSLAFSLLGYSGSLSSGDTENSRFDNALKYQTHVGPLRFGAIYRIGAPNSGRTSGSRWQGSAGFDVQDLSFDAVYSHVSGAVTLSSLSAAQVLVEPAGSLAGAVSDNSALLLSAKYSFGAFKFFGGYESIRYADPASPIAAPFTDSNGYSVSVVNNTAYQYHNKILQVFWTGVKYAYNDKTDFSVGYYHEMQNSYGAIPCNFSANTKLVTNAATCSGTEDAVGVVGEYHFSRKFEAYAGMMYSTVAGGMANGFLNSSTVDPMVGLRYAF